MGLRPVLGRLLGAHDDGADAAGAVVLTHRFWATALNGDPDVVGKTLRLGPRAATPEDVRAAVRSPERLNAFVFTGFAGIALLTAVVGIAGVLASSVSARTREFGIRLAIGSAPRQILGRVLSEGLAIAAVGIAAGPPAASSSRV